MNITITGTGYVGLSNAVLLSQKYPVIALDIDNKKVDKINERISPIDDKEISDFLSTKSLNLKATTDKISLIKMLTLSSLPHRPIMTVIRVILIPVVWRR